MISPCIEKNTARKYDWGTGCAGYILSDSPGLSVKQEIMPPGTKERWHYHQHCRQFFFVLCGEATFYVDDDTYIVNENKGIGIDPGRKHYVANTGMFPLEFLVISQPSSNSDRINIDSQ